MKAHSPNSFFKKFFLGCMLLVLFVSLNNMHSIVYALEGLPFDKLNFLPVIYKSYPPVEILPNYSYKANSFDGSIVGYGEVVNHTSYAVIITIFLDTFDANGKFIKTDIAYAVNILSPVST